MIPTFILTLLCLSSAEALFGGGSDGGLELVDVSTTPAKGQWLPEGARLASSQEINGNVLGRDARMGFTTLHSTTRNDDNLAGVAFAPVFEETFTVEERAFVPEGPTFLADGTILFTPTAPLRTSGSTTNHIIIALDGKTGERVWTADPGQQGQGGAPLVLKDPLTDSEVVYAAGMESAIAVDGTTGEVIWNTATGLSTGVEGDRCFGTNYDPTSDTIVALFLSGVLQAFDRTTGALRATMNFRNEFNLAPSDPGIYFIPPGLMPIAMAFERFFYKRFDVDPDAANAELLIQVVFGVGTVVSNYFSIDPDSGSIYVVATLNDGHEGDYNPGDGYSHAGALYKFKLTESSSTSELEFELDCRSSRISGGSAATPSISADGQRIYTADADNRLVAFDNNCDRLYSVQSEDQILGSVTLSPNNREIYAMTSNGLLKVIENEARTSGYIDGAYKRATEANLQDLFIRESKLRDKRGDRKQLEVTLASIATTAENGVMIIASYGFYIDNMGLYFIPLDYALVLMDRVTGAIINATPLREESVAVMAADSNGEVALGNSPARRVMSVFFDSLALNVAEELTGGITKYGISGRYDLHARDASCAASNRLANLINYEGSDEPANISGRMQMSVGADLLDVSRLIDQAQRALDAADGDFSAVQGDLETAENLLDANNLESANISLLAVCDSLSSS